MVKAPSPVLFPFMALPAEIRILVYEELLLDTHSMIVPFARLPPGRRHRSKSLYPVILRVSQTTYGEALPVLYSHNTFSIRTFPLQFFSPSLTAYFGPTNAALIRRIFTIEHPETGLDEAELKARYESLGVSWENLHLWAMKMHCEGAEERAQTWVEKYAWVMKVENSEAARLGLKSDWIHPLANSEGPWIIKRGSRPREL